MPPAPVSSPRAPASLALLPAARPQQSYAWQSLAVGVDDAGKALAPLPLVASHQHCIFERLLRQLLQFGEIFVQHLDLFDARDRLAFRRTPHREFAAAALGHARPRLFRRGAWWRLALARLLLPGRRKDHLPDQVFKADRGLSKFDLPAR